MSTIVQKAVEMGISLQWSAVTSMKQLQQQYENIQEVCETIVGAEIFKLSLLLAPELDSEREEVTRKPAGRYYIYQPPSPEESGEMGEVVRVSIQRGEEKKAPGQGVDHFHTLLVSFFRGPPLGEEKGQESILGKRKEGPEKLAGFGLFESKLDLGLKWKELIFIGPLDRVLGDEAYQRFKTTTPPDNSEESSKRARTLWDTLRTGPPTLPDDLLRELNAHNLFFRIRTKINRKNVYKLILFLLAVVTIRSPPQSPVPQEFRAKAERAFEAYLVSTLERSPSKVPRGEMKKSRIGAQPRFSDLALNTVIYKLQRLLQTLEDPFLSIEEKESTRPRVYYAMDVSFFFGPALVTPVFQYCAPTAKEMKRPAEVSPHLRKPTYLNDSEFVDLAKPWLEAPKDTYELLWPCVEQQFAERNPVSHYFLVRAMLAEIINHIESRQAKEGTSNFFISISIPELFVTKKDQTLETRYKEIKAFLNNLGFQRIAVGFPLSSEVQTVTSNDIELTFIGFLCPITSRSSIESLRGALLKGV